MANNQSVRRHLDAFTRGRIIGKLEENSSVTSVAAEFGIAHSIVSRLWRKFQTTGTAIRGFSSGHLRGTTPTDDRYIVLQARRNRRQTAGEISRHTTQATGRPISCFTVARRLHGCGLFARRPVRCVPLTPAHRRRRSLWCRGVMGLQFLFMDDNAPCPRTVAAEQVLESEDIERMDWPARSPDLNLIEHILCNREKRQRATPTQRHHLTPTVSPIPLALPKSVQLVLNPPSSGANIIVSTALPVIVHYRPVNTVVIVGVADISAHFGLIVDIKQRKLIDTLTNLNSICYLDLNHQLHIKTVCENSIYSDNLKQFPDLTIPSIHNKIVKHDAVHLIETKGQLVHAKSSRLRPEDYELTKKEFEYMMEQGICRPSKSNLSSPLHVVNKQSNGIRPMSNYKVFNAATIVDAYSMPHIHDFGQLLFHKTIFSKLDIARAYHHIPQFLKMTSPKQ
ncbi:transposable element Tcb1 transposase [Trichonephila clavipes]|nr:transposable element Tcb1 transposase [Trichonephila clavipes]